MCFAAVSATRLTAQQFGANASGQLMACQGSGNPQFFNGQITASTVSLSVSQNIQGAGSASATLDSNDLSVSVSSWALGSASAGITLNLTAPPGAGVQVRAIPVFSMGQSWTATTCVGQTCIQWGAIDTVIPASGVLPVSVSCSAPSVGFLPTSNEVSMLVTWSYPGVSVAGAPSPGCLGPAAAWTRGIPRVGNTAFGLTCTNSHPGIGGIIAVGTGVLATPLLFGEMGIWIDPTQPIAWNYVPSTATGEMFLPLPIPMNAALTGLNLYSQSILLEQPGCLPGGLSASNAIGIIVQG